MSNSKLCVSIDVHFLLCKFLHLKRQKLCQKYTLYGKWYIIDAPASNIVEPFASRRSKNMDKDLENMYISLHRQHHNVRDRFPFLFQNIVKR